MGNNSQTSILNEVRQYNSKEYIKIVCNFDNYFPITYKCVYVSVFVCDAELHSLPGVAVALDGDVTPVLHVAPLALKVLGLRTGAPPLPAAGRRLFQLLHIIKHHRCPSACCRQALTL